MKKAKLEYKHQVNHSSQVTQFDTHQLFDKTYRESNLSAIDTFFYKTQDLVKLLGNTTTIPNHLGNLIVLGYVSAVESYFREMIRKIIVVDGAARKACESQSLTYAAALIYTQEQLPEALLENCSFASKKNIVDAIRTFIGLKGHMPNDVDEILGHFSKVCQLRHCIIHRFGRLGSKNMIELGLSAHKDFLEKPLKLDDFNKLEEIFLVCNSTVKVINNFLFQKIMTRTVEEKIVNWHWDLRQDKTEFQKYYEIFASIINPPIPSTTLQKAYYEFKNVFKSSS